jgi:hypothetical protein
MSVAQHGLLCRFFQTRKFRPNYTHNEGCFATGLGVGVLVVNQGIIVGSDFSGGRYNGTLVEDDTGRVEFNVDFLVAPGTTVVQGSAEQDVPYVRPLRHIFAPDTFGNGAPFTINVPPGDVTVMTRRIPDEFAAAATDGFTVEIARGMAR